MTPNAIKEFLSSKPILRPVYLVLRWLKQSSQNLCRSVKAHVKTVWFLFRHVLPLMIRSGTRPVVFIRYMALGDIICTFPAAKELEKRHPKAAFLFFCRQDFACLPRLGGITTHVVWPPHIDLIETRYSFLFSAIYKFTYSDERENTASTESVIEEYCRQHGVSITDAHPVLQIDSRALSKVKAILESNGFKHGAPIILIHTGPSGAFREWANESWVGLVRELREHGLSQVIQIGSSKRGDLKVVPGISIPNTLCLVDKLTLEETMALISLGGIFIGIDSGLLHIATSVRTPSIGIFGSTSPQFRFSRAIADSFVVSDVDCQGCHHRVPRLHWVTNCPFDLKCMKSIQVKDVLQACLARIARVSEPDLV
jgi:ADP-heptose:LPS heptosyltransferase